MYVQDTSKAPIILHIVCFTHVPNFTKIGLTHTTNKRTSKRTARSQYLPAEVINEQKKTKKNIDDLEKPYKQFSNR